MEWAVGLLSKKLADRWIGEWMSEWIYASETIMAIIDLHGRSEIRRYGCHC